MESEKFGNTFSEDVHHETFMLQKGRDLYDQSPYLWADQTAERVDELKKQCTGSGKWVILSMRIPPDMMKKLGKQTTTGDKRDAFEQMEKPSVAILGYREELPEGFYSIG